MTWILPQSVLDFIILNKEFGPKLMDLCGRHPGGQQLHEKMFGIPNQQESAGHNKEMSLTQLRLSVIKMTREQVLVGMWSKGHARALLGGTHIGAAAMENRTADPQNVEWPSTSSSVCSSEGSGIRKLKGHLHPHVRYSRSHLPDE